MSVNLRLNYLKFDIFFYVFRISSKTFHKEPLQMSLPRVETQRSDQVSDVSQQAGEGDLLVNNLIYEQPKALSLAVNRTYNRQYFQRSDYKNGETSIIDLNSGSDYIDVANSYLTFSVLLTASSGAPECNFGSGSAMNLIRQVTLRSRSGTELDRVERANIWARNDALYNYPDSYLKKFGRVQGFGPDRLITDTANTNSVTATRFCIPLSRVAPFFRPLKKGMKLPPQLGSGLHLEIIWEDFRTALIKTAAVGVVVGYEISNLQIMCDSIAMTDDTQRTINMESASSGLEWAYPRIYTSVNSLNIGQTTLSAQVRKAVSQACISYACVLDQANLIDITADSMAAVTWATTRWQYRLGALYFPHQPIEDSTVDGVESYFQSQMVFDKVKHPFAESSVELADFVSGTGIMAVSLEKDTALNLSGLPINNSRVLELNAQFSAVAAPMEVLVFLEYCAVSKSFVDNTVVAL